MKDHIVSAILTGFMVFVFALFILFMFWVSAQCHDQVLPLADNVRCDPGAQMSVVDGRVLCTCGGGQ